jgi:integrase/recombinase XerD
MKLGELFELFVREKTYLVGVTPKTLAWYKDSWSAFKRMVGTPEGIDRFVLNDFVIGLRKAEIKPRSCNTYICAINSFLTWLWENGHTGEKLRIKPLKVEQKVIQTYSDSQLKAFISWKPKTWGQWRLFATLYAVIDTGARIDEMLSLKRSQVNFDQLFITVRGKGQKERILPMSPELRKVLYRWMQKHDFQYVFPTHEGNKWQYRNSLRYLKVLGKRLGIEGVRVSWHTFRHTFGYNYAKTVARVTGDARNGIFHLQRQLGHSSLQTTRIYVEIQPEDLKDLHIQTSILSRLK